MTTLIVGGGVIGLMSAYQLAEAGKNVTLVERRRCAREASWAGGGIVSPLYPWRYSEAVSALSRWSEGVYPELAERLRETTGIDPQYRRNGLLYLAVDDADQALRWASEQGKPMRRVDGEDVARIEPAVVGGPHANGGLWMPTLGSVRNPRLGSALRAWLQQHPRVTLREDLTVEQLCIESGRVTGLNTTRGHLAAERVLVCAGAWSGELLARSGICLPVTPVKGQMMVFRPGKGAGPPLSRVVLADGRYLIPRRDGRILVGSTLEHQGFDKTVTCSARVSLQGSARQLLPALAEATIEHHWAGLRPGSPGGIPFIGEVPNVAGLFVNAGHFRNGLVLAPAATRLVADLMLRRTPVVDPQPYCPPAADVGLVQPMAANWC